MGQKWLVIKPRAAPVQAFFEPNHWRPKPTNKIDTSTPPLVKMEGGFHKEIEINVINMTFICNFIFHMEVFRRRGPPIYTFDNWKCKTISIERLGSLALIFSNIYLKQENMFSKIDQNHWGVKLKLLKLYVLILLSKKKQAKLKATKQKCPFQNSNTHLYSLTSNLQIIPNIIFKQP